MVTGAFKLQKEHHKTNKCLEQREGEKWHPFLGELFL